MWWHGSLAKTFKLISSCERFECLRAGCRAVVPLETFFHRKKLMRTSLTSWARKKRDKNEKTLCFRFKIDFFWGRRIAHTGNSGHLWYSFFLKVFLVFHSHFCGGSGRTVTLQQIFSKTWPNTNHTCVVRTRWIQIMTPTGWVKKSRFLRNTESFQRKSENVWEKKGSQTDSQILISHIFLDLKFLWKFLVFANEKSEKNSRGFQGKSRSTTRRPVEAMDSSLLSCNEWKRMNPNDWIELKNTSEKIEMKLNWNWIEVVKKNQFYSRAVCSLLSMQRVWTSSSFWRLVYWGILISEVPFGRKSETKIKKSKTWRVLSGRFARTVKPRGWSMAASGPETHRTALLWPKRDTFRGHQLTYENLYVKIMSYVYDILYIYTNTILHNIYIYYMYTNIMINYIFYTLESRRI